ncbi:hypothetical protein [Pseudovibrio exalbescens]|uniref:hypothetical protein n=1 Tax=Pseudovibrio exalbescens TaxID=197461 RepID=UPI0011AEC531|nr:hypothetical protein [Pseudovibrio exalbescens]
MRRLLNFFPNIFLLIVVNMSSVDANENIDCLSNRDLLSSSKQESNMPACDYLGNIYLYGIGKTHSIKLPRKFPEEFQYYYFSRAYQHSKNFSDKENKREELRVLLSLVLSSLSDVQTKISASRRNIYKVYYLKEAYNTENKATTTSRGLLFSFIELYALDIPTKTWDQLDCFVLHDLPSFSVEEILVSEPFKTCMEQLK